MKFSLSEIGLRCRHFWLFRRKIIAFSDTEQRVVGVSGFVITQNNEGLIKLSKPFVVVFRDDSFGKFGISSTNGLLSGPLFDFEYSVVINSVAGSGSGERVFGSCDSSYFFEELDQHVLCGEDNNINNLCSKRVVEIHGTNVCRCVVKFG